MQSGSCFVQRVCDFPVNIPYSVFVYLDNLPVICHQTVHFYLDICRLCIYCGRKAFADKVVQFFRILYVFICHFIPGVELYIAPVSVRSPQMSFHSITYSSIFSQDIYPRRIMKVHFGFRIFVQIEYVPAVMVMISSAGGVYASCRIIVFRPLCDFSGLELSPSFVERYPDSDTRIVVQTINDFFPFFSVACL